MNRHPPQPFVGQRVFAALAFSHCLVHRELHSPMRMLTRRLTAGARPRMR
jgi:hypothetical protein